MARDMQTAANIVKTVLEPVMATELGNVLVEVNSYEYALQRAVEAVADLLDPDERFDAEVDTPDAERDELRHCGACGAVCDFRVQVCECDPSECPKPPVYRP